jgi:hypothetical protein
MNKKCGRHRLRWPPPSRKWFESDSNCGKQSIASPPSPKHHSQTSRLNHNSSSTTLTEAQMQQSTWKGQKTTHVPLAVRTVVACVWRGVISSAGSRRFVDGFCRHGWGRRWSLMGFGAWNNEAWLGGMGFCGPEWADVEVIAQIWASQKLCHLLQPSNRSCQQKSVPN